MVKKQVPVVGRHADPRPAWSFDQQTGQPVVGFRLNGAGRAAASREVTTENVGKRFAIILDNKVISAPIIHSPITGGQGQITGNFTPKERRPSWRCC